MAGILSLQEKQKNIQFFPKRLANLVLKTEQLYLSSTDFLGLLLLVE